MLYFNFNFIIKTKKLKCFFIKQNKDIILYNSDNNVKNVYLQ